MIIFSSKLLKLERALETPAPERAVCVCESEIPPVKASVVTPTREIVERSLDQSYCESDNELLIKAVKKHN